MNKTRKKNANWIYQILLILMVVAIAYHMFSYFLRLVYPSNQAAVEFQKVMELVRGQEFSLDHWLYIPIALITKMFSVFFGGVKIYKGFILAEVFVNVLVVLLLYEVNIRIFGMKMKRLTLCMISMACYLGVPAYFFLYGGNIKSSIWLMFFLILLVIWKKENEKLRLLESFSQWSTNLSALFWKIWMILICSLSFLLVGRKTGKDYVYFVPFILVTMAAAYWKREVGHEISVIYAIIVLVMTIGLLCNGFMQTDSIFWNTMRVLYWCVSWFMVTQAMIIAKEKKQLLELGAFAALVVILFAINIFRLDDVIRDNNRRLVDSEPVFSVDYFPVYMTNVTYLQTNYTKAGGIFFGSSDFIALAELVSTYVREDILIMTDEITETEGCWFQALTDCKSMQIDGMNSSDDVIRKTLDDNNVRYAVIFKDSRIYMLNYDELSKYPTVFENERGIIIEQLD